MGFMLNSKTYTVRHEILSSGVSHLTEFGVLSVGRVAGCRGAKYCVFSRYPLLKHSKTSVELWSQPTVVAASPRYPTYRTRLQYTVQL